MCDGHGECPSLLKQETKPAPSRSPLMPRLLTASGPTRVQKSHFQSTFQGAEQLLPLVSPFQAELEVLYSRLRLWEICKPSSDQEQCQALRGGRGRQCGTSERSLIHPAPAQGRSTSDDAEELLDAHAGVDAVEEPLDVAAPAFQGAAGFWRGLCRGAILQEHPAEPPNHLLYPLHERGRHRCGEHRAGCTAMSQPTPGSHHSRQKGAAGAGQHHPQLLSKCAPAWVIAGESPAGRIGTLTKDTGYGLCSWV